MSTPLAPPVPGQLAVGSLSQAQQHKRRYGAVLTLEDPSCRRNQRLRFHRPGPAHLALAFEDADAALHRVRVASPAQVAQALEFARTYAGCSLLVHCLHGVGRSAAVALAVLADRLGPGRESEAVAQLHALRPEAVPNLVVVGQADRELQRGGALCAALNAWEADRPAKLALRARRLQFMLDNLHLYSKERD